MKEECGNHTALLKAEKNVFSCSVEKTSGKHNCFNLIIVQGSHDEESSGMKNATLGNSGCLQVPVTFKVPIASCFFQKDF